MTPRYVKLDATHPDYDAALATCAAAFLARWPGRLLSVEVSPDGAVAWVKTTTDAVLATGGAVLAIEDGGNAQARADVQAWTPEPEGL